MNSSGTNSKSLETLVTTYQVSKCNLCFGELYTRYFPKLFNYCKHLTLERDDAYDIAMEAFVKASDKIQTLRVPEYFPTWLFRIAHNLFMDKIRLNKKLPTLRIDDSFDFVDDTSDHELQLQKDAQLQKMKICLEKIEPKNKEILIAKYINNNTINEIKSQFGITASATKMRLVRARKRMASLAS